MGICWPKNKLLDDYDQSVCHCNICRLPIKDKLYVLMCGHQYHAECILNFFCDCGKTYGYPYCPACGETHLESFEHIAKLKQIIDNKN